MASKDKSVNRQVLSNIAIYILLDNVSPLCGLSLDEAATIRNHLVGLQLFIARLEVGTDTWLPTRQLHCRFIQYCKALEHYFLESDWARMYEIATLQRAWSCMMHRMRALGFSVKRVSEQVEDIVAFRMH